MDKFANNDMNSLRLDGVSLGRERMFSSEAQAWNSTLLCQNLHCQRDLPKVMKNSLMNNKNHPRTRRNLMHYNLLPEEITELFLTAACWENLTANATWTITNTA